MHLAGRVPLVLFWRRARQIWRSLRRAEERRSGGGGYSGGGKRGGKRRGQQAGYPNQQQAGGAPWQVMGQQRPGGPMICFQWPTQFPGQGPSSAGSWRPGPPWRFSAGPDCLCAAPSLTSSPGMGLGRSGRSPQPDGPPEHQSLGCGLRRIDTHDIHGWYTTHSPPSLSLLHHDWQWS